MAGQLTERQTEIKRLLDAGKTPREIAESLQITENAVYQHVRRMRDGGHKVRTASNPTSRSGGSRRRSSPARTRGHATAETNAATAPAEPRAMTPLQAIRSRKDIIGHELREADSSVAAAEKALKAAQEAAQKVHGRHADEMKQLERAEAVLTGKQPPQAAAPKARRQRPAKATESNGLTAVTPEPDPAPAESPQQPTADPVAAEFADGGAPDGATVASA